MTKILTMKQVYALYLTEGCELSRSQAAKVMKVSYQAMDRLVNRAKLNSARAATISGDKTLNAEPI